MLPPPQTRSVLAGCADLRLTTAGTLQTLVNAQSARVVNIRSVAAVMVATMPRHDPGNVLHGRKSISCDNSVLPRFIGGSGGITPGIRPELHFAIQIDTTLFRQKSFYIHCLDLNTFHFYRTVVIVMTIFSRFRQDSAKLANRKQQQPPQTGRIVLDLWLTR